VGQTVTVRADTKLVRIYAKSELIKTHERMDAGGRSTDYNDYPAELAPYAMRDPDRMTQEARRQGRHIGRFMERLLRGDCPWAKLRQAQKLLRLTNKYGRDRLDAACRRALAFDLINVKRVEAIVESGTPHAPGGVRPPVQGELIGLPTRFLRSPESFTHASPKPGRSSKENENHGDDTITEDRPEEAPAVGTSADAPRPDRVREEDEA
jgi:hypothetical protein